MTFKKPLILLFSLFLSSEVIANSNDMEFSIYQPCDGNGSICSPYIFASGLITSDTPNKFNEFLKKNEKDLHSPIIYFNSNGGSLKGGIELARIIRGKDLDTYIGMAEDVDFNFSQEESNKRYKIIIKKSVCYSACAYAFLGGVTREIDWNNGDYGIHQFHSDGLINEGDAQIISSSLALFLDEMGINRKLLDLASFTKKDDILSLSKNLSKELRVENSGEDINNWSLKANQDGNLSICSTVKQEDNASFTTLCFLNIHNQLIANIIYLPAQKYVIHDVINRFSSEESSSLLPIPLSLKFKNNETSPKEITKWNIIDGIINKTVIIDKETLKLLLTQQDFSLDAHFSNANRHVDPSASFATDGLSGGIKAILK